MKTYGAVYSIKNKITERLYIGGTVDYISRWKQHYTQLKHGNHFCKRLQKDWTEFGPDFFEFKVLEELKLAGEVMVAEQKWLDKLNPYYNTHRFAVNNVSLRNPRRSLLKSKRTLNVGFDRESWYYLCDLQHADKVNGGNKSISQIINEIIKEDIKTKPLLILGQLR